MTAINHDLFGLSEDYTEKAKEKTLSLDRLLIKRPSATFFFRMRGNSMEPLVEEGDILLVDRAQKVNNGNMIILEYEGELICKTLFIQKDHYLLSSNNKTYRALHLSKERPLNIWGTVIGQVRKYI